MNSAILHWNSKVNNYPHRAIGVSPSQSGRAPKVVALFSATNFSSYIIELLQLHDTIQIEWNYAGIQYNIAIRSHLMI